MKTIKRIVIDCLIAALLTFVFLTLPKWMDTENAESEPLSAQVPNDTKHSEPTPVPTYHAEMAVLNKRARYMTSYERIAATEGK